MGILPNTATCIKPIKDDAVRRGSHRIEVRGARRVGREVDMAGGWVIDHFVVLDIPIANVCERCSGESVWG
jgi:hypothetical protein